MGYDAHVGALSLGVEQSDVAPGRPHRRLVLPLVPYDCCRQPPVVLPAEVSRPLVILEDVQVSGRMVLRNTLLDRGV